MAISFNEFLSQATSGDYRHGLGIPRRGFAGTTVVHGQADLEPGDYGQQYVMTTKPNTTVMSKRVGVAPVARRQNITRMISELEFLAGTPGIHERVLAQKIWQARKALMGTSKWSWANYQNPRSSYDSYDDLVSRLDAVEAVLGTHGVSSKLMSQLYGMGGLGSGTGWTGAYGGAPWGSSTGDPIAKLASCIRGLMCQPKGFCCPPGRQFEDPIYDEFPEFKDFPSAAGTGGGNGDTWIGDPEETWIQPPPEKDPIGSWLPWVTEKPKIAIHDYSQPAKPKRPVTGGGVHYGEKPKIKVGQDVKPVTTGKTGTAPRPTTGGNVIYGQTPKKAIRVGGGYTPAQASSILKATPLVGGGGKQITPGRLVGGGGGFTTQARQAGSGASTGGSLWQAPAITVGVHGLGARRPGALSTLVDQLRAARRQVRRAR